MRYDPTLPTKFDLILVDGMNLLHRAAHSYDLSFVDGDGNYVVTGPLFGFLSMALSLRKKRGTKDARLIFCWDRGYKHRTDLYPDYKVSRRTPKVELPVPDDVPEEEHINFGDQLRMLRPLSILAGWEHAHADGFEADDVMATLSRTLHTPGKKIAIYTGDQDLHQAVTEDVYVLSGKNGKEDVWGPNQIREKWGFGPERVAEMKGLQGDSGDDIPGCPGCGPVGAQKLLTQYGGLEEAIAAAQCGTLSGQFGGKRWAAKSLTKALRENADLVRISWELAKVVFDCPVVHEKKAQDREALRQRLNYYRFDTLSTGRWEALLEVGRPWGEEASVATELMAPVTQGSIFDLFE